MDLGSNTNFWRRERADSFQCEELVVWIWGGGEKGGFHICAVNLITFSVGNEWQLLPADGCVLTCVKAIAIVFDFRVYRCLHCRIYHQTDSNWHWFQQALQEVKDNPPFQDITGAVWNCSLRISGFHKF